MGKVSSLRWSDDPRASDTIPRPELKQQKPHLAHFRRLVGVLIGEGLQRGCWLTMTKDYMCLRKPSEARPRFLRGLVSLTSAALSTDFYAQSGGWIPNYEYIDSVLSLNCHAPHQRTPITTHANLRGPRILVGRGDRVRPYAKKDWIRVNGGAQTCGFESGMGVGEIARLRHGMFQ